MSVPSSVNVNELAAYMHAELANVATALALTVPASYEHAITRALIAYGVQDVGSATDVPRILALAVVEAWRMATNQLAPQVNNTTDGRTTNLRELWEHSKEALQDAMTNADLFPGDGSGANRNMAGRVVVHYCDRYA